MAEFLVSPWRGRSGLPSGWRLELFNSWLLQHDDDPVTVGFREQRLLALLALDGARARSYLSGILWPNSSEHHASASLRESVSRINHVSPGVVAVRGETLCLGPNLAVDVDEFHRCTNQIAADADTLDARSAVEQLKRADLLPGWYDDWILVEREQLQQLRVRALETLAEVLLGRDTDLALAAAMAAVRLDPLRDRAHRALLRVHLADGNEVEALRHYESFRAQLRREMGLAPSRAARELMQSLLAARGPTASSRRATYPQPTMRGAASHNWNRLPTSADAGPEVPARSHPPHLSDHPWPTFALAAQAVVSYLSHRFDMNLWLVTHVDGDRQHVIAAQGPWTRQVPVGSTLDWTKSFCARMVSGRAPILAPRAQEVPEYAEAMQGPLAQVRAYLGVPVLRAEDQLYGTLCAFAGSPKADSLADALPLTQLLSRMLSTMLSRGFPDVDHAHPGKAGRPPGRAHLGSEEAGGGCRTARADLSGRSGGHIHGSR